jgi:hypothetical protein|mmetsp:Transcript_23983/g.41314  ORF Transcript_23983/g.41314 Transcript_23983/m.41314 type:complete len:211 (+) Transcript_23983:657-1289(+)
MPSIPSGPYPYVTPSIPAKLTPNCTRFRLQNLVSDNTAGSMYGCMSCWRAKRIFFCSMVGRLQHKNMSTMKQKQSWHIEFSLMDAKSKTNLQQQHFCPSTVCNQVHPIQILNHWGICHNSGTAQSVAKSKQFGTFISMPMTKRETLFPVSETANSLCLLFPYTHDKTGNTRWNVPHMRWSTEAGAHCLVVPGVILRPWEPHLLWRLQTTT